MQEFPRRKRTNSRRNPRRHSGSSTKTGKFSRREKFRRKKGGSTISAAEKLDQNWEFYPRKKNARPPPFNDHRQPTPQHTTQHNNHSSELPTWKYGKNKTNFDFHLIYELIRSAFRPQSHSGSVQHSERQLPLLPSGGGSWQRVGGPELRERKGQPLIVNHQPIHRGSTNPRQRAFTKCYSSEGGLGKEGYHRVFYFSPV